MSFQFIHFNKKILGGKPIIKGSRISVGFVMEWIASGGTVESFYKKYSYLPKGSVEEAVLYAAQFQKMKSYLKVKSFLKHLIIKTFCNHRKDATKRILSDPVNSKRLNQSIYNIQ